mgnify:CR=1 FL=1
MQARACGLQERVEVAATLGVLEIATVAFDDHLQVGPLAVLPAHQRRGIGTALMKETIRTADARAEPLLLIEGNPKYYERFGFSRADAVGIEPPREAHGPQYFMIRPLAAYDPGFRGQSSYPPETFGIAY